MRSPRIVVSICLVALVLLIGAGIATQAQNTPLVFRIGVLDYERGAISNGARLAVREINESGGITDAQGNNLRLELVIGLETQLSPLDESILRLAQAEVDLVLGPETTEDVLAFLPQLQSLGIPILSPATGDLLVTSDSTRHLFRTRAAQRLQGDALADYLVSRLNVRQVISVQLDQASLGDHIGFLNALARRSEPLQRAVLRYDEEDGMPALVADILERNPQAVAAFGPPLLAGRFYSRLREAGWFGLFGYNQATKPTFIRNVPFNELLGILSTTTWALDTPTTRSRAFVNAYLDGYDTSPSPIEAASYDALYLLAAALRRPGDWSANLSSVRDLPGVQGILNRTGLAQGEMSDTVAVIQLNALGGTDLRLRYASGRPIIPEAEVVITPTNTPPPTATPEGVFLTILSSVQNVRSGPGLEYPILGQMRQGETARLIGTSTDSSWVVINFRGRQGWLAAYLLELTGDLRTLEIVPAPPPPTPTPAPTAGQVYIAIQSPLPGNLVAGTVSVFGSALHPQFLQYQLEFSPMPNPAGIWLPIMFSQTPVLNGLLGAWNTTLIPDGLYQIRLSVVLRDGTTLATIVGNIRVQNRIATPVPTATPIIAPPLAAFVPDKTTGEAPLTVRFINQSTGNISEMRWNFGDGTTSTETSPTHTFASPGLYTISLSVTGAGGTSNFSWQINVRTISAPVAGFSQNIASGRAPLTVQFTDQSVGTITSWLWSFSDGTTSTERNPAHTFSSVGTYNVFLSVMGPGGTSIASRQVVVESPVSPPPVAQFTAAPSSGVAPLTVQFTNQSTGNITGYTWNFGDGQLSNETNPVHIYAIPGTYTVTLYASGPGGNSTMLANVIVSAPTPTFTPTVVFSDTPSDPVILPTATFTPTLVPPTITFTPIPPTATFTTTPVPPTFTPTSTETPVPPTLTPTSTETPIPPTATFTPSETPTETPVPPTLTPTSTETPIPPTATFTPSETPTETPVPPTLTPTSTETPIPPTATFTPSETPTETPVPPTPTETLVPPVALFTIAATDDLLTYQFLNQSSGAIASLIWDFGDGTSSAEVNPIHTYAAPGDYNVTLIVMSADGITTNSATQTVSIAVPTATPEPTATLEPVDAVFAFNPAAGTPLTIEFVSQSTGPVGSYLWDFGDGGTSAEPNPMHTYPQAGDYTITLTVTALDGVTTDSAAQTVTVEAEQPPTPEPPVTLNAFLGTVNDAVWDPSSTQIAAANEDGTISLWDVTSSQVMNSLIGHTSEVLTLDWNPNGSLIASGSADGVILIWDLNNLQPIVTYQATDVITDLAWSTNGATVAIGSADGSLILLDTAGNAAPLTQASGAINALAWGTNDTFLLVGVEDGSILLLDMASGQLVNTLKADSPVTSVVWSPDSLRFVTGLADGTLVIWDTGTGQTILPPLDQSDTDITALAWHPFEARLLGGDAAGGITLWDTTDGTNLQAFNAHTASVTAIEWNSTGTQFLSASEDGTILIWQP